MDGATPGWWDRLIDRWVRVKSRRLDDGTLIPRKLLHTGQIVAAWPLLHLERRRLGALLAAVCAFVIATQRRPPYASAALLTLLGFARRPAIAGAWVVFTAGDGIAPIAGRRLGGPALPWNAKKTWTGSIAFATAATAALLVLLHTQRPRPSWRRALTLATAAAAAGALVESLDTPLDDNYTVIVTTGTLLDLLLRRAKV